MAEIKWISLDVGLFDNKKIKKIRRMPDGDKILLLWIYLLTLAGKCNDDGKIYLTKEIPYDENDLAYELNCDVSVVKLGLKCFRSMSMIEDDDLQITDWENHQPVNGMAKIREQNRIRKQKQRDRDKLKLLENNVTVTLPSRDVTEQSKSKNIDKDKDIDKDININSTKERVSKVSNNNINNLQENLTLPTLSSELSTSIYEFINLRKSLGIKTTQHDLDNLLKDLKEMSGSEAYAVAVIDQSIRNGWKWVYQLRD
jgi:predicted phage replisome organizer